MVKVSIIVPVYNSEQYIKSGLKNIFCHNGLKNVEVIVVDDSSIDNTRNILYNLKDKVYGEKLKIIGLPKNCGVSTARNVGIKASNGEYIGFVDIDDTINKNMFKKMYDRAKKYNTDICICNYREIIGNSIYLSKYIYKNELLLETEAIQRFLIDKISPSIWDKLFKKDFILKHNIKFNRNLKYGEDTLFTFISLANSTKVYIFNDYLYNYYQYENSSIHTLSNKFLRVLDIIKVLESEYSNIKISFEAEFEFFTCYLIIRTLHIVSLSCNKYNFKIAKNILKKLLKDKKQLIKSINNPYFNVLTKIEIVVLLIGGIKLYITLFYFAKCCRNFKRKFIILIKKFKG